VIAGNWRQCGCCRLLLPSTTRRSSVSGHGGEHSGPRLPDGASAATTSNGLWDHTRAMPRPVANIVRRHLCDAPHGASSLRSHSGHLPAATARAWTRTGDPADYEPGFELPSTMIASLRGSGDCLDCHGLRGRVRIATRVATGGYKQAVVPGE
jgi:hypothetical protein